MPRVYLTPALLSLFAFSLTAAGPVSGQIEVSTLASFEGNGGITVHPNGDLYVADFGNVNLANGQRVTRLSPDGSFEVFVDNLGNAMSGNDFDADGNLIQSAWGSGQVRRIAPDGSVEVLGLVNNPVGVAISDNGTIFVTSCPGGNSIGTIRRYNGTSFEQFASDPGFVCPNGLTFGEDGTLYTLTWGTNDVFAIDPAGNVSLLANLPGGGAHLAYGNGRLYVAARTMNQIAAVELDGSWEVIAGTGAGGNADGPADQATFSRPNGVAVSNNGRALYTNGSSASSNGPGFNAIRVIQLVVEIGYLVDAGISGSWYDPSHDGEGFLVEILDEDSALVYWFTYKKNGNQRWFVGVGSIVDDQIIVEQLVETSGPMFGANYDPDDLTSEIAGSVTLRFDTCDDGIAEYEIYGESGELNIQRLTRLHTVVCAEE